jgi:hypothetical protein
LGAGLTKQLIPLFVGGGVDTKTDPRLVGTASNAVGTSTPNGALLQLDNMFMARTGELRLRSGFNNFSGSAYSSGVGGSIYGIFPAGQGKLGCYYQQSGVRRGAQFHIGALPWDSTSLSSVSSALNQNGIIAPQGGVFPIGPSSPADVNVRAVDCAYANGWVIYGWRNNNNDNFWAVNKLSDGLSLNGATVGFSPPWSVSTATNAKSTVTSANNKYLVYIAPEATTNKVKLLVTDVVGNTVSSAVDVSTSISAPIGGANIICARARASGSNSIIIAWTLAAANSVKVIEFDCSTLSIVTSNTVTADASQTIGWIGDPTGQTSYYLAAAGATSGVVVRQINSSLAVTSIVTIDATVSVTVANICGYVTGANSYRCVWDRIASGTLPAIGWSDRIMSGTVASGTLTQAATQSGLGFSIVSDVFGITTASGDTNQYIVAAFTSPTQSTYVVLWIGMSTVNNDSDHEFRFVSSFCQGTASQVRRGTGAKASIAMINANRKMIVLEQVTRIPGIGGTGGYAFQQTSGHPVNFFEINGYANGLANVQNGLYNPVEIGGTTYLPGGFMMQGTSGANLIAAQHVVSPEPVQSLIVNSGSGNLTPSATYQYCYVYVFTNADGSIIRSAPSVPVSVSTGVAANWTANGNLICERWNGQFQGDGVATIEVYRAGGTAGSVTFNKVLTLPNPSGNDTVNFNDAVADTVAATGEILYTTGGVLDNLPAPPCKLMVANNGRGWVVNSENPTELWFSKQRKVGEGLYFHPLLRILITGDGFGAITGLSAMDGRVVVFKSNAIYVISGDGPDDTGAGSFNVPQAVSLSMGCQNPASIVLSDAGILFQNEQGIFLLDRGLNLTYIGSPVEAYTFAEWIVGASLVDAYTQVRFVTPSGRCLVYDYFQKRWYSWLLRSDTNGVISPVVGCAQVPYRNWVYALADGSIFEETPGIWQDVNVITTAIIPVILFPQVNTGGINGFQRVYCMQLEGAYLGDHTLQVSAVYDLGANTEPTRSLAITSGPFQYEVFFANPKCSTIQVQLTSNHAAGSGAFILTAASLWVGVKRGSQFAASKRLV